MCFTSMPIGELGTLFADHIRGDAIEQLRHGNEMYKRVLIFYLLKSVNSTSNTAVFEQFCLANQLISRQPFVSRYTSMTNECT